MTTKVVKGGIWNVIGQVLPLLVSLVTIPIVIRQIGAEEYGLLVLVGLIPTYLAFADLGMGIASTKFASEAFVRGSQANEAKVVRTAAVISLLVSVPFGLALFLLSDVIVGLLNIPEQLRTQASLALKFTSIAFLFNILNNIFNTPQLVRLRMDLNALVTSGCRILGVLAMPIVIHFGGGISGAVFALMAASILTLVGNVFISGRLNPDLYGLTVDKKAIRPLVKFGVALAISGVAVVVLVNAEKLVLTRVASVQSLAYYSVAFTFANMATLFTGAMTQSLVPALSQLLLPQKREQLGNLIVRSLRMNMFGLLPVLVVLLVIAKPFFTIWGGDDFGRESPLPFYVLLLGLFFNLNAYVAGSLIVASGHTAVLAKLFWIELIPYLAATAALTTLFGAVGAAMGWSIQVIITAFIFNLIAKRIGGVDFKFFEHPWVILFGITILSPPVIFAILVNNFSWWLAFLTPGCVLLYLLMLWKVLIDADEKAWITSKISQLENRFCKSH